MSKKLKIIFMGSADFAAGILETLLAEKFDIICVYSQPARPAKRGKHILPTPTAKCAEAHNIPLRTPAILDDAEYQFLKDLNADTLLTVAYGLIFPEKFLQLTPYGGVNIHGSLLPLHRGASPIHQAILHGDSTSGITLMQMARGLDSGDILAQQAISIQGMDFENLHDALQDLAKKMIVRFLQQIESGQEIERVTQDESQASYAPKLKRDDGFVNFAEMEAELIERKIRAFRFFPNAWCVHQGARLILHQADIIQDSQPPEAETIGRIISLGDRIVVQTQNGKIAIGEIQAVGGKILPVKDFLNGHKLEVGIKFGCEQKN